MNWRFPDYKRDLKKQNPRRVDAQPATGGGSTYVPPKAAPETAYGEEDIDEEGLGAELPDTVGRATEMRDVAQQLASRPNIAGSWAEELDHITKLIVGARLLEGSARKNALEEALAYLRQRNLKPAAKRNKM